MVVVFHQFLASERKFRWTPHFRKNLAGGSMAQPLAGNLATVYAIRLVDLQAANQFPLLLQNVPNQYFLTI
jgi:hypothetical protein